MRKIVLIFSTLILTSALISCIDSKEKAGNEIIQKIENYKLKNNRLPEKLADLGVEDKLEGPIYYQRKSQEEYEIWYGLELGESRTYNSKVGQWK